MTLNTAPYDTRTSENTSGGNSSVSPIFDITAVKDGAFHVYSSQISENYVHILRKHVLPNLELREGLRLRELRVLNCIFRHGSGLQGSDVVAIMRYDPATVSRALSRLHDHGMIVKEESPGDGRALTLSLTDKGQALAAEYRGKSLQVYNFLNETVGIEISSDDINVFLKVAELIKVRTTNMGSISPRHVERFLKTTDEDYHQLLKETSL